MIEKITQRIEQIRNDREHGSRWLVREAVLILRDLANASMIVQDQQLRLLYKSGQELARARPAMAALSGAVSRVLNPQSEQSGAPHDIIRAIAQEAQRFLDEYATATQQIATHAATYLKGHLMTCSISGTILETLAANRHQIERVTVLEGRPRCEGRETAGELSKQGIAVTLITDAQAAIFLPQCQAVVVGADSVLANGDVLNKAGTALLAWAARGYHVPFYVLCETLKISPHRWPEAAKADLELLEEHEPEEVLELPIPGVIVHNFYFDHTPYQLVSKLITERGVLGEQDVSAIAVSTEQNETLLTGRRV